MQIKKITHITFAALFLACLCLMRAVSVHASDSDIDEVYEATSERQEDGDEGTERSSQQYGERADIRLSRPEESASRSVRELNDPAYALVDGAESLRNQVPGAIQVPVVKTMMASGVSGDSHMAQPDLTTPQRSPASVGSTARPSQQARAAVAERSSLQRLEAQSPIPVREDYAQTLKSSSPDSINPEAINGAGRTISAERVRGVQEISVIASEHGFFPSRIFVTQGIPVKVFLSTPGKNTLCFMVDGLGVKKGITPGQVEEVSFTPDSAGDFRFYCPVKAIEGKMTVRAPAAVADTK